MTDLRVLMLLADKAGCAFYRMQEPARVVTEQFNISIEQETDLPVEAEVLPNGDINFFDIKDDVDVIVFQRPLLAALGAAMKYAQSRGIACVVEVDDDLSSVHRNNVAWRGLQPQHNRYANHQHLARAAAQADWVTVSTPALARRYGSHGRVSVCRNYVPESVLKLEKPPTPDEPRVGWTGSIQTHPADLDVAGSHIGTSLSRWGSSFHVVGDPHMVREKLYIPEHVGVNGTGWVPRDEYLERLINEIDIGVVPLEMSPFNQAKSYLKGVEMAACGIPFVASPTEEYRRLAELGIGRLAVKGQDWQKHLKQLLTSRNLLEEESATIREKASEYTYEKHAEEWVVAWLSAVACRRKNLT